MESESETELESVCVCDEIVDVVGAVRVQVAPRRTPAARLCGYRTALTKKRSDQYFHPHHSVVPGRSMNGPYLND